MQTALYKEMALNIIIDKISSKYICMPKNIKIFLGVWKLSCLCQLEKSCLGEAIYKEIRL